MAPYIGVIAYFLSSAKSLLYSLLCRLFVLPKYILVLMS